MLTLIRHNLVVAWRSLLKHRTTTVINILGLAIGLSAFLAIGQILIHELKYNQHIPDADRIYRVWTQFEGTFEGSNGGAPFPAGEYLQNTYPHFDALARFHTASFAVKIPRAGEPKLLDNQPGIILTDADYFDIVAQYDWIVGDPATSLSSPFQVVLTEDQAQKYFGHNDYARVVGESVVYQDSLEVTVSGIVSVAEENSDFQFTDFVSFGTVAASWFRNRIMDDWGSVSSNSQLFIKTKPNVGEEVLDEMISAANLHIDEAMEPEEATAYRWYNHLRLQPLADLHYNTALGIFDNSRDPAHKPTLTKLGGLAIALLLIAVFNFINLETAQAMRKSKEVGVRKALGSPKSNLYSRFLSEGFLQAILATAIAVPLAAFGLKQFESFLPEPVTLPWSSPGLWLFLMAMIMGTGLLAGAYPSWIISRFQPIKALKAGFNARQNNPGSPILRKVLISFQFVTSQLLIIGTLAIILQIRFMVNQDLGFSVDGTVYFSTPYYESPEKLETLFAKLQAYPSLGSLTQQRSPPVENGWNTSVMTYGEGDSEIAVSVTNKFGDSTYLDFYNLQLVAGRNIRPASDQMELLINETYFHELGLDHPRDALGKELRYGSTKCTIVGVMEDFHFQSMHNTIKPLMFRYSPNPMRTISFKPEGNLEQAQQLVENVWAEVYPDMPLRFHYLDDTVRNFYQAERQARTLASCSTVIAILISCLGLFGLISFTITQKSKEMGIRKVLGASAIQIGRMLSREFLWLLGISFTIAVPLSVYMVNGWMTDFAYRTPLHWWLFGTGGLVSLTAAVLFIGMKVWRAAATNPVKSLRYE